MNNKKIELNGEYTLQTYSKPFKVRVLYFRENGVFCEFLDSWVGRQDVVEYEDWKMNGFDITPHKTGWWVEMDIDRPLTAPIFKHGDKVMVCDDLETKISGYEYIQGEWRYFFKDELGLYKSENESAIDLINSNNQKGADFVEEHRVRALSSNSISDDINFNVESEAVRLTSAHYKLQRGNWSWKYGDEVEKDSWEMAKEHAKLSAEENVKLITTNKLDVKYNFWISVMKQIDEL